MQPKENTKQKCGTSQEQKCCFYLPTVKELLLSAWCTSPLQDTTRSSWSLLGVVGVVAVCMRSHHVGWLGGWLDITVRSQVVLWSSVAEVVLWSSVAVLWSSVAEVVLWSSVSRSLKFSCTLQKSDYRYIAALPWSAFGAATKSHRSFNKEFRIPLQWVDHFEFWSSTFWDKSDFCLASSNVWLKTSLTEKNMSMWLWQDEYKLAKSFKA